MKIVASSEYKKTKLAQEVYSGYIIFFILMISLEYLLILTYWFLLINLLIDNN